MLRLAPLILALCLPSMLHAAALDRAAIEQANYSNVPPEASVIHPLAVKTQILLDRAGFSPGEIDGKFGENADKALRAFAQSRSLPYDKMLTPEIWGALSARFSGSLLAEYAITEADIKGPFLEKPPKKLDDMKGVKRMSYRGPREALAERFHMSEELLAALNTGVDFKKAGARLAVANVLATAESGTVTRVEVNKEQQTVRAFSKTGELVAFYPATVGSEEKPSPSGTLKVAAVRPNPFYRYNPDYKFKGVKAKRPFTINPGPNNPAGSTWIALSEKGYGIHGTPEPSKVSKAESNGCVRLTNWDAERLGKMVKKGISVDFVDGTGDTQANAAPKEAMPPRK